MNEVRRFARVWLSAVLIFGAASSTLVVAFSSPELSAPASASPQTGVAWIRVAVVRDQPQVDLAIHGRFRIVALRTPAHPGARVTVGAGSLQEGRWLPQVIVRATQEGILVGERVFPLFGVRVEPAREATINLNGQRLRGTIEILRQPNLTLLVVNQVALEDYLRGVLSKEAPHYWPKEALRALAIAARTYTLFQRLSKTAVDYDVTGDIMSQVYGGRSAEKWQTTRAVRDTEGVILTYQGRVFPAFYHSTCGGLTEHASVMGPYDVEPLHGGVTCSFCQESPFYRWERRLSKADIAWALKQKGFGSVGTVTGLDVVQRTATGRAAQVLIRGTSRTLTMKAYDFRALFGFEQLRSVAFTVEPEGDNVLLRGQGWGHGVGLCQWGTAELARRGLSAREILAVYYPHAEVVRLGEVAVQPVVVQGGS